MATALDAPLDKLDPHEQKFVSKIREHGWFRTSVFGDDTGPGFSYTTGFTLSLNAPEVIVFSMKPETAHTVFWDLYKMVQNGQTIQLGERTDDVFANLPAYLFPVARRHYREHLGWSRWFYGSDEFPCVQLVWSDRAGVFPWQPGFDQEFADYQPDLTEAGWGTMVLD